MEDGHSLFDYDVGMNDVIQLMVRPLLPDASNSPAQPSDPTTSLATSLGNASQCENDSNESGNEEQIGGRDDIGEGVAHKKMPDCTHCKDNPRRKCKHCACSVCGGKDSPDKQILCDDCDMAYHLWCLVPSLDAVPDTDDW